MHSLPYFYWDVGYRWLRLVFLFPILVLTLALVPYQPITPDGLDQVKLLTTFIEPQYDASWRLFEVTLAFSSDGFQMAIANGDTIHVWNAISGERHLELKIATDDNSIYTNLSFSPDGNQLASISSDWTGTLWDTASGQPLQTFSINSDAAYFAPDDMIFSPDGQHLAIHSISSELSIFDVKTGVQTDFGSLYGRQGRLGYLTSGLPVVVDPQNGLLSITDKRVIVPFKNDAKNDWDQSSDRGVPNLDWRLFAVFNAFDTEETAIRLWDTLAEKQIGAFDGHTNPVVEVVFSGDGRVLASRDRRNNIRLWEVTTGKVKYIQEFGSVQIKKMALNHDGTVLILLTEEGILRLRDVQRELDYIVSDIPVEHLYTSPDVTSIVTGRGPYVMIYGIPTDQRPAYTSLPARVAPSAINIRQQPSLDAPIIGYAPQGEVIVTKRDESSQFVYLPDYEGWARANPSYLDFYGMSVNVLSIHQ